MNANHLYTFLKDRHIPLSSRLAVVRKILFSNHFLSERIKLNSKKRVNLDLIVTVKDLVFDCLIAVLLQWTKNALNSQEVNLIWSMMDEFFHKSLDATVYANRVLFMKAICATLRNCSSTVYHEDDIASLLRCVLFLLRSKESVEMRRNVKFLMTVLSYLLVLRGRTFHRNGNVLNYLNELIIEISENVLQLKSLWPSRNVRLEFVCKDVLPHLPSVSVENLKNENILHTLTFQMLFYKTAITTFSRYTNSVEMTEYTRSENTTAEDSRLIKQLLNKLVECRFHEHSSFVDFFPKIVDACIEHYKDVPKFCSEQVLRLFQFAKVYTEQNCLLLENLLNVIISKKLKCISDDWTLLFSQIVDMLFSNVRDLHSRNVALKLWKQLFLLNSLVILPHYKRILNECCQVTQADTCSVEEYEFSATLFGYFNSTGKLLEIVSTYCEMVLTKDNFDIHHDIMELFFNSEIDSVYLLNEIGSCVMRDCCKVMQTMNSQLAPKKCLRLLELFEIILSAGKFKYAEGSVIERQLAESLFFELDKRSEDSDIYISCKVRFCNILLKILLLNNANKEAALLHCNLMKKCLKKVTRSANFLGSVLLLIYEGVAKENNISISFIDKRKCKIVKSIVEALNEVDSSNLENSSSSVAVALFMCLRYYDHILPVLNDEQLLNFFKIMVTLAIKSENKEVNMFIWNFSLFSELRLRNAALDGILSVGIDCARQLFGELCNDLIHLENLPGKCPDLAIFANSRLIQKPEQMIHYEQASIQYFAFLMKCLNSDNICYESICCERQKIMALFAFTVFRSAVAFARVDSNSLFHSIIENAANSLHILLQLDSVRPVALLITTSVVHHSVQYFCQQNAGEELHAVFILQTAARLWHSVSLLKQFELSKNVKHVKKILKIINSDKERWQFYATLVSLVIKCGSCVALIVFKDIQKWLVHVVNNAKKIESDVRALLPIAEVFAESEIMQEQCCEALKMEMLKFKEFYVNDVDFLDQCDPSVFVHFLCILLKWKTSDSVKKYLLRGPCQFPDNVDWMIRESKLLSSALSSGWDAINPNELIALFTEMRARHSEWSVFVVHATLNVEGIVEKASWFPKYLKTFLYDWMYNRWHHFAGKTVSSESLFLLLAPLLRKTLNTRLVHKSELLDIVLSFLLEVKIESFTVNDDRLTNIIAESCYLMRQLLCHFTAEAVKKIELFCRLCNNLFQLLCASCEFHLHKAALLGYNVMRVFDVVSNCSKDFHRLIPSIIADFVRANADRPLCHDCSSLLMPGLHRLHSQLDQYSIAFLVTNLSESDRELYRVIFNSQLGSN
ncbi:hypothetical protein T4E_7994 [Trichinella pseudospiralis]|uniref:Uncharacterized protein n=1 Tax=Trichinella pseudospiralis TaxID=6337 RepID=A0A0V0XTL8_TRIPS|nr:hypothetical protein T4E_7994 [Trichinella pseudospiralis]